MIEKSFVDKLKRQAKDKEKVKRSIVCERNELKHQETYVTRNQ